LGCGTTESLVQDVAMELDLEISLVVGTDGVDAKQQAFRASYSLVGLFLRSSSAWALIRWK